MARIHSLFQFSLVSLLALQLTLGQALAAPLSTPHLRVDCSDPSNLPSANPEYVKTLSDMLMQIGAKKVTCTSCYRDIDSQRRACVRVCGNPEGCKNRCAKPGRSQHQRKNVATCDLSGMPEGSCWTLKKLCDEKYGGKCGIGGYAGGGYHFGVGDYRFSAWNKCKGLPRGTATPTQSQGVQEKPGVYLPPQQPDPSEGDGGSELEADALLKSHEIILIAAAAIAGTSGYLLYKKWRNNQ